jgi:hypothetical protein
MVDNVFASAAVMAAASASASMAHQSRVNGNNGNSKLKTCLEGSRYRVIAINTYSNVIWVLDAKNKEIVEIDFIPRHISPKKSFSIKDDPEYIEIINDIFNKSK